MYYDFLQKLPMQLTVSPNLAGLALRVRTIAAGDVVFIYAEPDLTDLDLLLREQLYRDLLTDLIWKTDKEAHYKG